MCTMDAMTIMVWPPLGNVRGNPGVNNIDRQVWPVQSGKIGFFTSSRVARSMSVGCASAVLHYLN